MKKIYTLLVLILFITTSLFSQTYQIDVAHNTTVSACKGSLIDSENYGGVFLPSCGGGTDE